MQQTCCGYLIHPSLNERRIVWDEVSSHHKRLVYRELQTEQWYVEPGDRYGPVPEEEIEMTLVPLALPARRHGNGVHPELGAV
jgi:hypothetical protein